jgi:hypothetical protein
MIIITYFCLSVELLLPNTYALYSIILINYDFEPKLYFYVILFIKSNDALR